MGLVELMVWVAISLLITTVIGTIYVNTKQLTRVNDTISRLQESGRFVIHLLDRDMRMAGFRGCNPHHCRSAQSAELDGVRIQVRRRAAGILRQRRHLVAEPGSSISTLSPAPMTTPTWSPSATSRARACR